MEVIDIATAREASRPMQTPAELRTQAQARIDRAEQIRLDAEREEQAGWGLMAQAAIAEAGSARHRPRRRPPVGRHGLIADRLIAVMERLCIDEEVNPREGLGGPMSLVEDRIGIDYSRRGTPTIGARMAIIEEAVGDD